MRLPILLVPLCLTFAIAAPSFAAEAKKAEAAKVTKSTDSAAVVAKVNGVAIKRGDLDLAVKIMMAQSRMGHQAASPEMKAQVESAAMQQIIASELLYQAGQKLEMKDLDKEVEKKLTETKSRYPSPADFEKELKNNGLTENELKELTRKSVVINNYIEKEIVSKISITEADAKKFYDDNKDKFKNDESVRASHILIKVDEKATADDKKKAKEKAEDILKKVKAGGDFAELAKKESGCPSATVGGDLGYFGKGQMVPAFEQAAFALKPGEISNVVETQFGYHIIKVTDHKQAGTVDFSEAKPRIEEYLKGQKAQKAVMERVDELKGKAKIEVSAAEPKEAKKAETKEPKAKKEAKK